MVVFKSVNKMKKGQFKIQQMAFMILAIILFFILVGLFWLALHSRTLKESATGLEENKAIMLAEFLSDSAEFSCAGESYCIDTDKIINLQNRSVYREFWPVSFIKIRKIFPINEEYKNIKCNKQNYPNCGFYKVYENKNIKSKSSISSFVALCRYEKIENYPTKICDLGKIIIGYELK